MLSYDESKKTLTVTYNGNPSITNVVLSNDYSDKDVRIINFVGAFETTSNRCF